MIRTISKDQLKKRKIIRTEADRILRNDCDFNKGTAGFSRTLNELSFASECWFKTIMERNFLKPFTKKNKTTLDWQQNYKFGSMYIDFAFPKYKIAIEIDGRSHDNGFAKSRDSTRDEILKNDGWIILRVAAKKELAWAHLICESLKYTRQVIINGRLYTKFRPWERVHVLFLQRLITKLPEELERKEEDLKNQIEAAKLRRKQTKLESNKYFCEGPRFKSLSALNDKAYVENPFLLGTPHEN